VQTAYHKHYRTVVDLFESEQFERALEVVDAIEKQYGAEDASGWLHRSILADRALILDRWGKLEEAKEAYLEQISFGFLEPSDEASTRSALARLLFRVRDFDGALEQMKRVLVVLDSAHPAAGFPILRRWVETTDGSLDHELFKGAQTTLNRAILAQGIELPSPPVSDPRQLILWAAERIRSR
jgi:hypothetical protein